MKEEMLKGYFYSFLSPLVVSLLIGISFGVHTAIEKTWQQGFGTFYGMFLLGLFFGSLISGLFCAVVGLPTYYILRKFNVINVFTITSIGVAVAYLCTLLIAGNNLLINIITMIYGGTSAFFFWLGSNKARTAIS